MVADYQLSGLAAQFPFALKPGVWRWVGLLLLGTLLSACVPSLSGQLLDDQGLVLFHPDARVNVLALEGHTKAKSIVLPVDKQGRFRYEEELPEGLYFIEALVPGYEMTSLRFHIKETRSLNLTLEPLPMLQGQTLSAPAELKEGRAGGQVTLTLPQL